MPDQPLVSFIIVCYKQERFVREALRSALAQTYEPLEIIVTDDSSPDRTFEIVKEEVAAYQGPHKVVIHQNQPNLGLAGNINKAVSLATGQWIIVQAGDDISLPERTTKLVKILTEPTPVDMACSNVLTIDDAGNPVYQQPRKGVVYPLTIGEVASLGLIWSQGCASAYSPALWKKYGPLDPSVMQEDLVLPFRALLERGIRVTEEPLLMYRKHGNNLYDNFISSRSREINQRWATNRLAVMTAWMKDWATSGRKDPAVERDLSRHYRKRQMDLSCYGRSRAYAALVAIRGLFEGVALSDVVRLIRQHVIR